MLVRFGDIASAKALRDVVKVLRAMLDCAWRSAGAQRVKDMLVVVEGVARTDREAGSPQSRAAPPYLHSLAIRSTHRLLFALIHHNQGFVEIEKHSRLLNWNCIKDNCSRAR